VSGELALRAPPHDRSRATHCFTTALTLARLRSTKLWELRASVSMARLHVPQSQPAEALNVLATVHEWFTDGVETVDLAEARAMLGELGRPPRLPRVARPA
jgi:predicted ATPase